MHNKYLHQNTLPLEITHKKMLNIKDTWKTAMAWFIASSLVWQCEARHSSMNVSCYKARNNREQESIKTASK